MHSYEEFKVALDEIPVDFGKKELDQDEKDWLKTNKEIAKGEILTRGYDHVFGLLSWNYKHDGSAGSGGTEKTKERVRKLLDDVNIDIFAMQELLWRNAEEIHIGRKNDKFGMNQKEIFDLIFTGKETGFMFNSSMFKCEKWNHVQENTIDETTFEGVWNTRTCIGKFTIPHAKRFKEKDYDLVFYGVCYHGPKKKAKKDKKKEFIEEFFKRIRMLQTSKWFSPVFIVGDFNYDLENIEFDYLRIVMPDNSKISESKDQKKNENIDFACVMDYPYSPWKIDLCDCTYEAVEYYQGISNHPPIFAYLSFKFHQKEKIPIKLKSQ